MATDLQQRLENLKVEIKSFTNQITRILNRLPAKVGTSDNSAALNSKTSAQMKSEVDASITAHAAATNNPHKLTAALLDAATPAQVTAAAASKAVQGGLPVTQVGTLDASPIFTSSDGLTLSFTMDLPFLCWGTYYLIPKQSITLQASKRYYVYAAVADNVAGYQFSETYLPETVVRVYIGQVVTTGTGLGSIALEKVTKFDNFRVYPNGRGGSIPMTTGLPTHAKSLDSSWKS